jgi:hypothetical protein
MREIHKKLKYERSPKSTLKVMRYCALSCETEANINIMDSRVLGSVPKHLDRNSIWLALRCLSIAHRDMVGCQLELSGGCL